MVLRTNGRWEPKRIADVLERFARDTDWPEWCLDMADRLRRQAEAARPAPAPEREPDRKCPYPGTPCFFLVGTDGCGRSEGTECMKPYYDRMRRAP